MSATQISRLPQRRANTRSAINLAARAKISERAALRNKTFISQVNFGASSPQNNNTPTASSTPLANQTPNNNNNNANNQSLPPDEKSVISQFESDLDSLALYGQTVKANFDGYQRRIQQDAINALAKCLGVGQRYFKTGDVLLQDKIYAALYKKATDEEFTKKRKGTSEYHLISRIYRGDDRRQASSDALILKRANEAGQTEQTFPAWVLAEKGLDAIRRKIAEERQKNKPVKTSKIDKRKISENFVAALRQMKSASLVGYMKSLDKDRLTAMIGELYIPEAGTEIPLLLRAHPDGSYVICNFDMKLGDKNPTNNDYL